MYCRECGADMGKLKICPKCSCDNRGRSRLTAGLLQIMLGGFGVGRFYLGYRLMGLGQLAATLLTCGFAGVIWGFIDGILILNGSVKTDAAGVPLAD